MNAIRSLFLLVIVIAFLYFMAKGLWPVITRRLTWKNNLIWVGIYFVLLLFLVPVFALLPKHDFVHSSKDGDKELLIQAPRDWSEDSWKYHIPPDGRFEEQSGLYKNSSQTFQVDTNQITLESLANTGYLIYIERKDSDDKVIEVSSYVAPHYADAIDFTRMVSPPRISFEKGILTIEAPSQQNLQFKSLNDSFTVNQFKQKDSNTQRGNFSVFGGKAVYIQIPKNLEIIHDAGVGGQMTWVNRGDENTL